MKKLPWILVILLAVVCVVAWFRPHEPLPAEIRTETKVKTVVEVDTLLYIATYGPFIGLPVNRYYAYRRHCCIS